MAGLVEILGSRSNCVARVTSGVNGWPDQKLIDFSESGVKITLKGKVLAGLVEILGSRSYCVVWVCFGING